MKKGKKAVIAAICTMMIMLFTGCDGLNAEPNYISGESGDFKYRIYNDWDSNEKYIALNGLTEEGKKKEIIVVPTEIDGYPVEQLSYGINWYTNRTIYDYGFLESENLKVIYLPHSEISIKAEETFLGCPNLEKIVYIGVNAFKSFYEVYYNQKIYFPCLDEDNETSYYFSGESYYANTVYCYNYEGAENEGHYWVDYFAYGEKIGYIPEEPKRTGYTFGGWYKEAECENIWNFEADILPQAKYDHLGDELLQKTKLYAKWIKE